MLLLVGVGLWRLLSASTVVGRCCLAVVCASWLGAGWACGCVSAWFCGTALWLGRPVASSLVAAVRRWFALLVWLGLRVWLLLGGGWCQQGGAVAVAACCSAVVCAAALRLGRPVPGCAASLVAAVRRWFAPPVWLGLRCAVDLLLLCVSDVGDMPAVDGEAGITKSKAKCALSFFPRAPLRHSKKAILVLAVAVRSTPLPWREPRRGSCLWPLWQALPT